MKYFQNYKISECILAYVKVSVDTGIFDFKEDNIPKSK